MTRKKLLGIITASTFLLLLIPLIAMLFTDEVNWGPLDFLLAGGMLFGTGLVYVYALSNMKNHAKRDLYTIALLAVLILLWADAATGILG